MKLERERIDVTWWHGEPGEVAEGYTQMTVRAGPRGEKVVVPPAGPEYAFTVEEWARTVVVSVSPTGRSVRVWVDGEEVSR